MKKSLLLILAIALSPFIFAQDCSDLFISEYVEGSGNNKAIEIYNPTESTISLDDYILVRYSNGGTTPHDVSLAGGSIESFGTYVVVIDKQDPNGTGYEEPVDLALAAKADVFLCPVYNENKMMYFNGNDAVTLEKTDGAIVDIFAKVGLPDTESGWTNFTDTTITWSNQGTPEDYTIVDYGVGPLFWLSWTENHTLLRDPKVKKGVLENPAAFNPSMEWDSIPQNTFEFLGGHWCDCNPNGIGDNNEAFSISVYPNPVTNGELYIDSEEKITNIEVINILGKAVMIEASEGMKSHMLHLDGFTKGIYFVRVTFQNDSKRVEKIIIE